MKIDICSDLHVDAWMHSTTLHDPARRMWAGEPFKSMFYYIDWKQYKNADSTVLIIAGDISNNMITTTQVVAAAAEEYEYVVVVDGNHDHYDNDMPVEQGMDFLTNALSRYPNVYHLKHDTGLLVDGVAFLGATGWYDFKAYESQGISDFYAKQVWRTYSNDSRYPTFEAGGPDSLAMSQAINLATQVKTASEDDDIHAIVVSTHMSPRGDLMEWKANDKVWNALTPSYVSTALDQVLSADINDKIVFWAYGHTHTRQMVKKDGIVYINNARGYPRENAPFSLLQIEVPAK